MSMMRIWKKLTKSARGVKDRTKERKPNGSLLGADLELLDVVGGLAEGLQLAARVRRPSIP